jgi:hypothetical protein
MRRWLRRVRFWFKDIVNFRSRRKAERRALVNVIRDVEYLYVELFEVADALSRHRKNEYGHSPYFVPSAGPREFDEHEIVPEYPSEPRHEELPEEEAKAQQPQLPFTDDEWVEDLIDQAEAVLTD